MRKFVERALAKFDKLDAQQIRSLLRDLSLEHDRLDATLDSLSDGLLVADRDDRLVQLNKAASRLLPLYGPDLYEKPVHEVIVDEDISRFVEQTLKNQESVVDREFTIGSAGTMRILSISVTPLVRSGRIQGSIVHVVDVSEKRSREARLRRAESLASLTHMAASVAHEINNPLGSMSIHMQLIQRALAALHDERTAAISENIDVVNEEIERLHRIVVDFMFAVQPMDTRLADTQLNTVVRELTSFVRVELQEAGIELSEQLEEDLPVLELDEKYLKQALLNLVKNAIHAMPDGGELLIATRAVGEEVELRISDTGVGMPDHVVGKIFEPYFTTKDQGTGIGLTLVYKVVKEHMGDISVMSQEGKGSSFALLFPVPQREQHLIGWKGN
jgi:two-component system, sporulation sensor kinase E